VSSSRTRISPCLTRSPVADIQLADDAAGRVLDLLDVGVDDDLALRDQRAGTASWCRPTADAESRAPGQ
jgi:hypothetical protein